MRQYLTLTHIFHVMFAIPPNGKRFIVLLDVRHSPIKRLKWSGVKRERF